MLGTTVHNANTKQTIATLPAEVYGWLKKGGLDMEAPSS
jgi:hypothetical protein